MKKQGRVQKRAIIKLEDDLSDSAVEYFLDDKKMVAKEEEQRLKDALDWWKQAREKHLFTAIWCFVEPLIKEIEKEKK